MSNRFSTMHPSLRPMLASRGEVPLNSPAWSYEIKWDGMRALASRTRLLSRHGVDCTTWFPELRPALDSLPPGLFDGEIVCFSEGKPHFATLQRRIRARGSRETDRLTRSAPATLILFDALELDGRSLLDLTWEERRRRLEWGIGPIEPVEVSPPFDDGAELWRAVAREGLEGVIAKRRSSLYLPGHRSRAWVKLKTTTEEELVVGGWIETPAGGITAVMLAAAADGPLTFRGHAAFGLTQPERLDLLDRLLAHEHSECPFTAPPPRGGPWTRGPLGPTHWVRPEVRLRVRSYASAGDGLLRDAVMLHAPPGG